MTARNHRKQLSYREAYKRINDARNGEYYFEAVTLAESIMSDRLLSYLAGKQARPKGHPSFKGLIEAWKRSCHAPIKQSRITNLQQEVDTWRISRNKVVHGLVHSEPGQPTESVEDFLSLAKHAANEGAKLARAVCSWHQNELNKFRKITIRIKKVAV